MPNRTRNEALLGVGIAVGAAALAIGSRYLARRAHEVTEDGLVDWRRVEQLAVARLRQAPGGLSEADLMAAGIAYEHAMNRVVPILEQRLGLPLPGVVERHGRDVDPRRRERGGKCRRKGRHRNREVKASDQRCHGT